MQNLPPLTYDPVAYYWRNGTQGALPGLLTGTNATIIMNDVYGNPTDPVWEPGRAGSVGDQAGAAYLFYRNGEQWLEVR